MTPSPEERGCSQDGSELSGRESIYQERYLLTPHGQFAPEDVIKTSLQAWLWHPCQRHFLHRPPMGVFSGGVSSYPESALA
ncbi:MAG: hypothetical protein GY703_09990 [Gammaproteobacteria bacterium]|nr:hypothetical protein [Gammaproteobacteria bacterium]